MVSVAVVVLLILVVQLHLNRASTDQNNDMQDSMEKSTGKFDGKFPDPLGIKWVKNSAGTLVDLTPDKVSKLFNLLVEKWVDKLLDLAVKASPLHRSDLNNSMLVKSGCLACPPSMSPRPLQRLLARQHGNSWGGHQPPLLVRASPHRNMLRNRGSLLPPVRASAQVADTLVEPIFAAFQLFFLLPFPAMVFAPNATVTRAVMQSPIVPTIAALLFLTEAVSGTIVDYSTGGVFDGEAWRADANQLLTEAVKDTASMRAFASARPHYLGQDWLHVCSWDLIGATVIYRDGQERQVPTRHSVLLCQILGPVGWLSHAITTSIWQKLKGAKSDVPA